MMPYALAWTYVSVVSATVLLITAFVVLPRWQRRSARRDDFGQKGAREDLRPGAQVCVTPADDDGDPNKTTDQKVRQWRAHRR